MKILYSCISESFGGLEIRTIQGAEQLLKRNFEVDILCVSGSRINREAETKGINCIKVNAAGYFHPLQTLQLAGKMKSNSYDIIHTQYSRDLWIIVPALKFAGSKIPLLLTRRMESGVNKKDFLHKWLYNRVNLVLAISNLIKENVIKTSPVPAEKVLLHYNGVDLQKFNPKNADRKKIREEYRISEEEILIGMLGRLSFGKGHEEFLFAAQKLNSEYNNLKFIIAGDAAPGEENYEQKIKALIENYNLGDKVILTGFRNDTADVLAAMDIFVFPSHSESFGNALVEAMAMEKPSVSTNSHGILDIVINGVTGYLFERMNRDDLFKKLKLLIDPPEKRNSMGNEARKRVIENFDIEKQTDKLIELYKKIID